MTCLWIALALEKEGLSWTLVATLEWLINENEEINKTQQLYFSVISLLFSGYPEFQNVLPLWARPHSLSIALAKVNSKLK